MIVRIDIHLDTDSERDANDIREAVDIALFRLSNLILSEVVVTSEILDEE